MDQLLADLAQEYDANVQEWNSYSPRRLESAGEAQGADHCLARSAGWLLHRAFILGDKAMRARAPANCRNGSSKS